MRNYLASFLSSEVVKERTFHHRVIIFVLCETYFSRESKELHSALVHSLPSDAPSITISSPTLTATLRQSFVLTCSVEGQPNPTIQWTPPEGLTPGNYRTEVGGALTVFTASARSIGVYTCMASNSVGSDSSQIEVDVKGESKTLRFLFLTNLTDCKIPVPEFTTSIIIVLLLLYRPRLLIGLS